MFLTALLTSCKTTKEVQYIYPEIYFPDFPKPSKAIPYDENMEVVRDNDKDIKYVCIPFNYYRSLADFKLEYNTQKEKYYTFVESVKK